MRERRIASSVRAWLAQSKSCASVEAAPSERHDRPQAAPGTSLAGCFLRAACSARTLHRPPQAGCVRRARSYLPPELPFLGIREREGRNRTRGRDGGERVGASQPGSRQPASQPGRRRASQDRDREPGQPGRGVGSQPARTGWSRTAIGSPPGGGARWVRPPLARATLIRTATVIRRGKGLSAEGATTGPETRPTATHSEGPGTT